MPLMRQIAILVIGLVLAALLGGVALSALSVRHLLQAQLQVQNADNAAALALSLSQQKGDEALMRLLVSAQFDTGTYDLVRWRGVDGQVIVELTGPARASRAPAWFVALNPIAAPAGAAQVSNGWQALGAIELASHSAYAHDALWQQTQRLTLWMVGAGAVALWVAWLALQRIRRPLDAAVVQAESVANGNYVLVSEPRVPELQRLIRAMNAMVQRVQSLFEGQTQQLLMLRQQAHLDPLTRVSNRKHFLAELDSALARDDGPAEAGLVLVRLRELDMLNQRLGRPTVDEVLMAIAQAMGAYPQRVPGCIVGRLNGADFGLWLPAAGVAGETAQALIEALRMGLPAFDPSVQVALGAVDLPRDWPRAQWLCEADAALARAEVQTGFALEAVASNGSAATQGEQAWRAQLLGVLEGHRGRLLSYPVIDRAGRLLHLECPLQLQLDVGGEFWPAQRWLPVAVRSRLTAQVDLLAVALALEAARHDDIRRCVNIAPASLLNSTFVASLREQLLQAPPAARRLLLDLGEGAATQHFELLLELGRQLRPLGVRLGIEHAGADLANVDRLYLAGLDYVKLDAAVVGGVAGDAARAAFVRGMVIMLRSLNVKTFAEGVVDPMDVQALWDCEIDGVTGSWATASVPPTA